MIVDPLTRRVQAMQKTLDRFQGREFAWGRVDCAKIGSFHLRQFGHKPPLASTLQYRSAIRAKACLKKLGCKDISAMIDQMGLPQKPPAMTVVGDVVSFAADDPMGALGFVVGNGNMFAFHESHKVPIIMSMANIERAWGVM